MTALPRSSSSDRVWSGVTRSVKLGATVPGDSICAMNFAPTVTAKKQGGPRYRLPRRSIASSVLGHWIPGVKRAAPAWFPPSISGSVRRCCHGPATNSLTVINSPRLLFYGRRFGPPHWGPGWGVASGKRFQRRLLHLVYCFLIGLTDVGRWAILGCHAW